METNQWHRESNIIERMKTIIIGAIEEESVNYERNKQCHRDTMKR